MSEEINKALDLAPLDVDTEKALIVYEAKETGDSLTNDIDYARDNVYELIGTSKQAIEEMLDVAKQSQQPRAYEVLNTMIKTLSEINKDLLEMQKVKKSLVDTTPEGPTTVNNTLFVGTTSDFNKLIEEKMKNMS